MRLLLIPLTWLIVSCGGGGSSSNVAACSTEKSLLIQTTWNSNGAVGARVDARLNVPLIATPTVTGIPASCKGKETFAIGAHSALNLPLGLTLDAATGVISGTPLQVIGVNGPHLVDLVLPGYGPVEVLAIINVAP